MTVEQIKDEKAVTVHENITGKDALTIMLDEDVERAPVVDDEGTMVGIVSLGDIIRGHKTLIEIKEITG